MCFTLFLPFPKQSCLFLWFFLPSSLEWITCNYLLHRKQISWFLTLTSWEAPPDSPPGKELKSQGVLSKPSSTRTPNAHQLHQPRPEIWSHGGSLLTLPTHLPSIRNLVDSQCFPDLYLSCVHTPRPPSRLSLLPKFLSGLWSLSHNLFS